MLTLTTSTEYANRIGLEIDWDETGSLDMIQMDQEAYIQKILTLTASIYLLRRSNEVDGSNVDTMVTLRSELINEYEEVYGDYKEFNDYY